jgi:hypothetical protein
VRPTLVLERWHRDDCVVMPCVVFFACYSYLSTPFLLRCSEEALFILLSASRKPSIVPVAASSCHIFIELWVSRSLVLDHYTPSLGVLEAGI